jgi:hypothetical protein
MAPAASPLQEEHAGLRVHVFDLLVVLVMKVSFLTYFVLTPWLKTLSQDLSVSVRVSTLVAVVYESGKFAGTVLFGQLGTTRNVLLCTLGAMAAFVVNAALLSAYLASGWRTHTGFDFLFFLMLYLPLSVVCMAPQFGLAILKKTNSEARCKTYIMIQGLAACMLQGSSVPLGQTVGQAFGWQVEFLFLAAFMGLVAVGIYMAATPAHISACQPTPQLAKILREDARDLNTSYWSQVRALVFGARHRSFQVWCLALGVATADMYLLPMYGMTLLSGSGDRAASQAQAANMVGATFIPNFLARVTSLLLASRVASGTWVRIGMPFLLVGSVFALAPSVLPTAHCPDLSTTFVVAGSAIQLGVGLVMPNCKAGALFSVPDESASAANSLLKLSQLVLTAMVQGLATLAGSSSRFENFSVVLIAWNLTGVLGFLCWECSRRRTSPRPILASAPVKSAMGGTPTHPSDRDGSVAQGACQAESDVYVVSTPSSQGSFVSSATGTPGQQGARAVAPLRVALSSGASASDCLVRLDNVAAMSDPTSIERRHFVETFNTYGVCVLECSEEAASKLDLHSLFGNWVPHDFADATGSVTLDPSAEKCSANVRDTQAEHQLHTDEAYSSNPGKIITMRCEICAQSGGESVLVSAKAMYDAAAANLPSDQLEALFSPCLKVGRALPGSDAVQETTISIFSRLPGGRVGVRWRSRDAYVSFVAAEATPGYLFLEEFVADPRNRFILKLSPGQVVVMDNTALLHGRLPFESSEPRRYHRINF